MPASGAELPIGTNSQKIFSQKLFPERSMLKWWNRLSARARKEVVSSRRKVMICIYYATLYNDEDMYCKMYCKSLINCAVVFRALRISAAE